VSSRGRRTCSHTHECHAGTDTAPSRTLQPGNSHGGVARERHITCNGSRPMMITVGQLVSDLYANYELELHEEQLSAVATEIKLTELLECMPRRRGRGRKR